MVKNNLLSGRKNDQVEAKLYLLTRHDPMEQPPPQMVDLSKIREGRVEMTTLRMFPLGMMLALEVAIGPQDYTVVGEVVGFARTFAGFTIHMAVHSFPKSLIDELDPQKRTELLEVKKR